MKVEYFKCVYKAYKMHENLTRECGMRVTCDLPNTAINQRCSLIVNDDVFLGAVLKLAAASAPAAVDDVTIDRHTRH